MKTEDLFDDEWSEVFGARLEEAKAALDVLRPEEGLFLTRLALSSISMLAELREQMGIEKTSLPSDPLESEEFFFMLQALIAAFLEGAKTAVVAGAEKTPKGAATERE